MKKTKNITKYEIEWQILRSSIKGQHNKEIELKLQIVYSYYEKTCSYDRWERVVNWLEGLQKGFRSAKDESSIDRIEAELQLYKTLTPLKALSVTQESQADQLSTYTEDQVTRLWKDLFKTNENWLLKGYHHRECNDFLDWIQENRQEIKSIKGRFSVENLRFLRVQKKRLKNTHKFFF